MLDRNTGQTLSALKEALPVTSPTLTMRPHCADELKYEVLERIVKEYEDLGKAGVPIPGRKIDLTIVRRAGRSPTPSRP